MERKGELKDGESASSSGDEQFSRDDSETRTRIQDKETREDAARQGEGDRDAGAESATERRRTASPLQRTGRRPRSAGEGIRRRDQAR